MPRATAPGTPAGMMLCLTRSLGHAFEVGETARNTFVPSTSTCLCSYAHSKQTCVLVARPSKSAGDFSPITTRANPITHALHFAHQYPPRARGRTHTRTPPSHNCSFTRLCHCLQHRKGEDRSEADTRNAAPSPNGGRAHAHSSHTSPTSRCASLLSR